MATCPSIAVDISVRGLKWHFTPLLSKSKVLKLHRVHHIYNADFVAETGSENRVLLTSLAFGLLPRSPHLGCRVSPQRVAGWGFPNTRYKIPILS